MFCKYCGKEIPDNTSTCIYCKKSLVKVTVDGSIDDSLLSKRKRKYIAIVSVAVIVYVFLVILWSVILNKHWNKDSIPISHAEMEHNINTDSNVFDEDISEDIVNDPSINVESGSSLSEILNFSNNKPWPDGTYVYDGQSLLDHAISYTFVSPNVFYSLGYDGSEYRFDYKYSDNEMLCRGEGSEEDDWFQVYFTYDENAKTLTLDIDDEKAVYTWIENFDKDEYLELLHPSTSKTWPDGAYVYVGDVPLNYQAYIFESPNIVYQIVYDVVDGKKNEIKYEYAFFDGQMYYGKNTQGDFVKSDPIYFAYDPNTQILRSIIGDNHYKYKYIGSVKEHSELLNSP